MTSSDIHIVTGAFGFLGSYIARRLLAQGRRVRTLTQHPDRPNPFGGRVEVAPYHFEHPGLLTDTLRGAAVLYNTYWIRFEHGDSTFARAAANTKALITAAREAGVRRFVHISITNPSESSPLPYFRGKALTERALMQSGLSYAILRPTVLFGSEDILLNNIAWLLRRLPLFGVSGSGQYRLQPVYVDDLAGLAVRLADRAENVVADAAGPETYTFDELLLLIRRHMGSRSRLVHIPPGLALAVGRIVGWVMRDVVITGDEIAGLMANVLVSDQPPICLTRFSEWLTEHADRFGMEYASELERHYR